MKIRPYIYFATLLAGILISSSVSASIKLPALFTDNMVLQRESIVPVWGWANPDESIKVSASWLEEPVLVQSNSRGEWRALIQTPQAGGPYTMSIEEKDLVTINNILIGEVWLLSGQSNMEMPLKGYKSQPVTGGNDAIVRANSDRIRIITVPRNGLLDPANNFEGKWEMAKPNTVSDFSAIGWFYADYLVNALEVPVGLIESAYGGSNIQAWMSEKMLEDFSEIQIPGSVQEIDQENRTATLLYNAMLKPILGYGIRGVLWYQGESNVINPANYEELLVKMVDSWRKEWGQNSLDFYFAQIAPYNYRRYIYNQLVGENNGALLREAQRKAALRIPDGGMVVLMDVGEQFNIHPPKKMEVAARFAYLALAETYGFEGFEYRSPEIDQLSVNGKELTLTFKFAPNGLVLVGPSQNGNFQIAGEDQIFYEANTTVKDDKIVFSSSYVNSPVAIRYAQKNFSTGTLFSSGGLPVSSFKTDNWD